jgi:hypothetical protein
MNARNVQVIGNTCVPTTRSFISSVFLGNGCERQTIELKGTNWFGLN